MKELADILRLWQRQRGQPMALATLVGAQGSSYRRPGARMLLCADGSVAGSLSGGCLEEEVAERGRDVLRTGLPALMSFDTRLRFGCNGKIEIFVERLPNDFLREIAEHLRGRRGFHVATIFDATKETLGSKIVSAEGETLAGTFVQEFEAPIQLVIFGDGPDSAPLRAFAEVLGWSALEIEHASNLPVQLDQRTAAIVKSHNYGRDFAALRHLLQRDLRYVGLLGPRKRRDQLLAALLDDGLSLNAELYAPTGLDLGAETPEEIALAIVAEIQTVFAEASGESLRDRKAPIHGWNLLPLPRALVAKCEVSAR